MIQLVQIFCVRLHVMPEMWKIFKKTLNYDWIKTKWLIQPAGNL